MTCGSQRAPPARRRRAARADRARPRRSGSHGPPRRRGRASRPSASRGSGAAVRTGRRHPRPLRAEHRRSASSSPAGREPRNAIVTCRFSAGTSRTRSTASCSRCHAATAPVRPRRAAGSRERGVTRSSAPTVPDELMPDCARICVRSSRSEMERRRGRAAAHRVAVAGQLQLARQSAPAGRTRAGRRARPASRASRRRARRCPVTETATSAPSRLARTVGHRRCGLGRDGAVRGERLHRHTELRRA